jgi:methylenetetrahydrofolate--tRNA-(uracil-5-)-methyltransferase
MRALGSVILEAADQTRVPAGRALAVDRGRFSDAVTAAIASESVIKVIHEECIAIPSDGIVIIATGPLTSDSLAGDLARHIGTGTLYFYDSISPIVTAESIDLGKVFFASRYDSDQDDYLNCPMDRVTYEKFVGGNLQGRKGTRALIRGNEMF